MGKDFVVPNRKKIGGEKIFYFVFLFYIKILDTNDLGELLQLNYENTYHCNKMTIMKDARTFGIAWLGDGATIKHMPLLNMLALCGEEPPVVISIFDCSDHMSEGGKKDAQYIGQLFKDKVAEFDPTTTCTDAFFFDGASNVQKAGEILCATYPRAFCFHGGEHVLSLFFSDLADFRPIKVSVTSFSIAVYSFNSNYFADAYS